MNEIWRGRHVAILGVLAFMIGFASCAVIVLNLCHDCH